MRISSNDIFLLSCFSALGDWGKLKFLRGRTREALDAVQAAFNRAKDEDIYFHYTSSGLTLVA